jgi:hypothetical protein
MKMIPEYLEHAIQFERMAAEATDATLKARMLEQAKAYRRLAEERANYKRLKLSLPPGQQIKLRGSSPDVEP